MSTLEKDIVDLEAAPTLDQLFRERVRRSPDAPAYKSYLKESQRWSVVTWDDAGRKTQRWQAALAAEDLEPGDRVALSLRNSPEWVYFEQAALGLGLVVVPLYTDDRPDNVAYILRDASVKVLLVGNSGLWRRLAPFTGELASLKRVLILDVGRGPIEEVLADARVKAVGDWLPERAGEVQDRRGEATALATIVYTSGTTGRPKGVMLSHHNIMAISAAVLEVMDCYRQDVFLSFLPLSHTLERTGGYYLPMMAGAAVAFARSVPQLAQDLQQVRPTLLIAVPRIFERFYSRIQNELEKKSGLAQRLFQTTVAIGLKRFEFQQGRRPWSPELLLWPLLDRLVASALRQKLGGRLRIAVSGGAALGPSIARLFTGLGLTLLQGYGLTETSPVISVNRPENNEPTGVGLPLPGVEVRIGEDDELLAKSPGVMMGYWNNPEATAAIIDKDGWLHTGDQANIRDGHIHITGRIKDILVLSNGEKVPPGDMEGAVTLDELIDQAIMIGEGQPFLSALVVLNADAWTAFAAELGVDPVNPSVLEDSRVTNRVVSRIGALLTDFPGYAKVRRVILSLDAWTVENGLLTPTLKVKRNKVLERYSEQVERIYREGPTGARQRVA